MSKSIPARHEIRDAWKVSLAGGEVCNSGGKVLYQKGEDAEI